MNESFLSTLAQQAENICFDKAHFLESVKSICIQASVEKPLLFLGIAIFLNLLEDWLQTRQIKNNNIIFTLSMGKYLCVILAMLFTYYNYHAYFG
jgi:hypothetical protein